MPELSAKRTLVKSPPELWAELSEVAGLARHLDAFGEIKITKLEPERTVAWEGDLARGTVSIEPSGWGTSVTLTASTPDAAPRAEAPVAAAEHSDAKPAPAAAPRPAPPPRPAVPRPAAEPPRSAADASRPAAAPPVDASRVRSGATGRTPASTASRPDAPIGGRPPVATRSSERKGPARRSLVGRVLAWFGATEPTPAPAPKTAPAPPSPAAAPRVGPPAGAASPPVASPQAAEATSTPGLSPSAPEQRTADTSRPPESEPAQSDQLRSDRDAPPGDSIAAERAQAVLDGALDALGSAHHRPFSRA